MRAISDQELAKTREPKPGTISLHTREIHRVHHDHEQSLQPKIPTLNLKLLTCPPTRRAPGMRSQTAWCRQGFRFQGLGCQVWGVEMRGAG